MNDDTLIIALFGGSVALITPILSALVVGWVARKSKLEDWARQDEVARKVEQVKKQQQADRQAAQKERKVTDKKVDKVHALVNGSLTAALRVTLEATTANLNLLRENMALQERSGKKPSKKVEGTIEEVEKDIHKQKKVIERRDAIQKQLNGNGVA